MTPANRTKLEKAGRELSALSKSRRRCTRCGACNSTNDGIDSFCAHGLGDEARGKCVHRGEPMSAPVPDRRAENIQCPVCGYWTTREVVGQGDGRDTGHMNDRAIQKATEGTPA